MTSPFINTIALSSLNKFDSILKNPEAIAFYSTICKHKTKSGYIFIKNVLIKCCELVIEPTLINAINKDIITIKPDTDITVDIKLFIGKMINNIYDNKINTEVSINIIYDMFFKEIVAAITKDVLLLEIFKHINTLEKDAITKLDNGRQLFIILINVLYELLLTKFDECSNKLNLGDSKTAITFLKDLNIIYEFKSNNYDYDSSETSDSSDYYSSDLSSDSESDDIPKQTNKRKSDENNTEPNKKIKPD